jgi:hypothetical protein
MNNVNEISHDDFIKEIRRYRRTPALVSLGKLSFALEKEKAHIAEVKVGHGLNPRKTYIMQWGLSYLSYMFVLFATEYRSKDIDDSRIALLCNWYTNLQYYSPEQDKAFVAVLRMTQEQLPYQEQGIYYFARSYYMMKEIACRKARVDELNVNELFLKVFKLTIDEYYLIAWSIYTLVATSAPVFNLSGLLNHDIVGLKDVLCKDKVNAFLDIVSASIDDIKKAHSEINANVPKGFEKFWLNQLRRFPIIRLDKDAQRIVNHEYLVVNSKEMFNKLVEGIYWAFRDYFLPLDKSENRKFSSWWGRVFQDYVGELLIKMFGDGNVFCLDLCGSVGNGELADWLVNYGDEIIIFECKSSTLPLPAKVAADQDKTKKWCIDNLGKGFAQLINTEEMIRSGKINYGVLVDGKNIQKIVITYQNLFMYSIWEQQVVHYMQENGQLKSTNNDVHILGLIDLELLENIVGKASFQEIFDNVREHPAEGFRNICSQLVGEEKLSSSFLDEITEKFFEDKIVSQQT